MQLAYLDATKYVEPKSSVYIEHWKLWLRSKSSIGGGGGGPNMAFHAENAIFSAELPFWGICSKPPSTYLNPTKRSKPTSSVYTRL